MRGEKQAKGARGEKLAARYLKSRGYRIVTRNYRCRYGEIDLIASRDGLLVFIEVKARTDLTFAPPEYAVNRRKQQRIINAASHFIRRKRLRAPDTRFDIIIVGLGEKERVVAHHPGAF